MCNSRKAWIFCEDGAGFRVELYSNWTGDNGNRVTTVWCKDESHANITADTWEREGTVV